MSGLDMAFDPSAHPRGANPGNPGEFSAKSHAAPAVALEAPPPAPLNTLEELAIAAYAQSHETAAADLEPGDVEAASGLVPLFRRAIELEHERIAQLVMSCLCHYDHDSGDLGPVQECPRHGESSADWYARHFLAQVTGRPMDEDTSSWAVGDPDVPF